MRLAAAAYCSTHRLRKNACGSCGSCRHAAFDHNKAGGGAGGLLALKERRYDFEFLGCQLSHLFLVACLMRFYVIHNRAQPCRPV